MLRLGGKAYRLCWVVLLIVQFGRNDIRSVSISPEGRSPSIVANAVPHHIGACGWVSAGVLTDRNVDSRSCRVVNKVFQAGSIDPCSSWRQST